MGRARLLGKRRLVSTAQLDLPLEDVGGFSFVLDLAGLSLSCFVSRLALVERAGAQLYRGLPVGWNSSSGTEPRSSTWPGRNSVPAGAAPPSTTCWSWPAI